MMQEVPILVTEKIMDKGKYEEITVGILRLLRETNISHIIVEWIIIMFDSI